MDKVDNYDGCWGDGDDDAFVGAVVMMLPTVLAIIPSARHPDPRSASQ